MDVYLGVDWSARELECALQVGEGRASHTRRGVTRRAKSVQDLIAWARTKSPKNAVIHVVIEDGADGWVRLLHGAGAVVHVVNAARAAAYAASLCSSGAKDDKRDAAMLASLGSSPKHCPPPWEPDDEQHAQLVVLSGLHETLTSETGRAEQRLRALLRDQFPALEAVLGDLSRSWVCRLLRAIPTPWHARGLSEADVRKLLDGSGARSTSRDRVVQALADTSATWLTEVIAKAHAHQVQAFVAQIELFGEQIAEVEKQLDACTADLKMREQLQGVDGIGAKMANRILRFTLHQTPEHRDEAAIQLGAAPVFQGSAKTAKGRPKGKVVMRKSVAPYARSSAYLLGRLASQQLGWAGKMYEAGRQRGQTAATAYRRVARSMLRILSAMARTGEAYDDARYVATLKAKGVPWAQELAA